MWIGTSRGLSHFSPSAQPPPNISPVVVFTSVKFGDREISAGSRAEVPYRDGSLQVRFAALTFAQESAITFRYRITGVTGKWLETTQRELNYPKLPPANTRSR